MRAEDYRKVQLRMCVEVTEIAEEDDLYVLSMRALRSDQQGGKVYEMKMGLGKDFIDGLDKNQISDLIRHEVTRQMFDGLGKEPL